MINELVIIGATGTEDDKIKINKILSFIRGFYGDCLAPAMSKAMASEALWKIFKPKWLKLGYAPGIDVIHSNYLSEYPFPSFKKCLTSEIFPHGFTQAIELVEQYDELVKDPLTQEVLSKVFVKNYDDYFRSCLTIVDQMDIRKNRMWDMIQYDISSREQAGWHWNGDVNELEFRPVFIARLTAQFEEMIEGGKSLIEFHQDTPYISVNKATGAGRDDDIFVMNEQWFSNLHDNLDRNFKLTDRREEEEIKKERIIYNTDTNEQE